MAFHHFTSPADIAKRLSTLLSSDGVLIVIDTHASEDDTAAFGPKPGQSSQDHVREIGKSWGLSDNQIEDIVAAGGMAAHHEHAVPHRHGFSKEDMKEMFENAGLKLRTFRDAFEFPMGEKVLKQFVAVAGSE